MSAVLSIPARRAGFPPGFPGRLLSCTSEGAGDDAKRIKNLLAEIRDRASRRLGSAIDPRVVQVQPASMAERLDTALASAKVMTSNVVMHLDREWRDRLFAQLDDLLDIEDWHEDDEPLLDASFRTFLRLILYQKPKQRPGLGLSHRGHLIAAWTRGADRLTLECAPDDTVRWVLSCEVNGERERAAGETHVARLPEILQPYSPDRWFADVNQDSG
jgi:hypothetical protein